MKHRFLYIVLLLLTSAIGVWAQEPDPEPINLTSNANGTEWTLAEMPAYHVKLEVEYYPVVKRTTTGENPTDYYYLSLAEAIAAAQDGETITMLDDENLGTTSVTINNSITLDLNGKTLTYTGTGTKNEDALTISSGKTVIIIDTSTGAIPGKIEATGEWDNAISNYGTLTVNGGSITSPSGRAIWNKNLGTVTVNVGTISGRSGIINYGTLTVTGGSISTTGDNCIAISIYTGTFNLSGNPTISGTTADIYLLSGMVINIDAALTAPTTPWTVEPYKISVNNATSYTFTTGFSTYCLDGTDVADPADYFAYYNNTAAITTRLSSTGEAEFANAGASITRGGVNLYYETFAEIFADANNYANGDVIKLLADEDLGTTGITISKNLTLDLNGHTLTYTGTERALTVNNYKTVIIQDTGTGENPGGITSPSGTAIYNDSGASLTVTGGTISGRACITNWGDLNVTGGSFSATGGVTWSAISIQTGTFNLSGNPTLTVTNNTSAIYLGHDMVINIPAALTAPGSSPENAWTVNIFNGLPYVFTGDWPSTMSTADPALFFKSRTEGVTTRFVNGTSIGLKKAQFVICSTLTLAKTGNGKVELDGVEPAFEEVTLDMISSWHQDEQNNLMQADLEGFGAFSEITLDEAMTWPKPANCSKAALFYAFDGTTAYYVNYENSDEIQSFSGEFTHNDIYELMNNGLKVYYTTGLTYPDGVTATTTDGVYIVDFGTELTVKATPNKNNYFKNWTVDNVDEADDISVGVKTYTIDAMGTENVSLTANFAAYPKLTLAANPVAGGKVELADITDGGYSINVKYDDVDYPFPTMTTFPYYINQADLPDNPTNIQTDNCDFQGATWDDTNHRLVINAPFNDKITLYFDNWTKSYDITCTANEPILPDGVTKVTTLVDGSEAFAQDEYHNYKGNLFTWSDDVFENVEIGDYPISITPQDDADAPVFMTSVELTKSSGDFANLAVVKPSSGVTTSMSGNTLTITMPENTTEVKFKTTSGAITLSGVTVNYAAVTPVEGEYFVEPGTAALNLKATAAAIYHTVDWTNATVNNTDITKATVTVTEDVTVTTNFELDPVLTLVADPTTGGTVEFANGLDPFAEITADMIPNWAGDNTDLSAADLPGFVPLKQDDAKNWSNVPAEGVSIVLFEIQNGYFNNAQYQDGECVGNSVTYYSRNGVLSEINNSGHRVFYTIASLPAGVNAKGNGQYYVEPGTQVTLKATPAAIHHLVSWSDNVTVNGTDNTIATITVNDATTVTATFAEDPTLTVASTTGGTVALDGIEEVTLSKALDNGSTVQINWHGTSDVGDLTATFINNNGTFTKTAVNDEDNMNNICLEQDNNNLILSGDNPHVSGKMRITINTSAKTYSITKDAVWTNYDFTLTSVVVNGAVFTPDGEDLVGGIIMPVGVTTTTTEGVYNVAPGSDVTVKATAVVVDNYHFDKWTDENDAPYTGTGYTIGYSDYSITSPSDMFPAKSTITFSMGTDDMTMKGNFEKFSVTVPAGKSVTYYTDIKFKVTDANAAIYTISSVSGSEAVLSDVITVAPANTPLLIHNSSNENKTFDIIPTMEDAASVTVSSQFKGTATAKTTADTDTYGPWNWAANTKYYGFNGTNFVWINAAGDVAAHRCWLETSTNSAPILTIDWDGNATGIKQVDSLQFSQRECGVAKTVESYYDLNGRKLQSKPTKKGVYILNGRKMVVK